MSENPNPQTQISIQKLFEKAFSLKALIEKEITDAIDGVSWYFDENRGAWVRKIKSISVNETERAIITACLEGLCNFPVEKKERLGFPYHIIENGDNLVYWIRINGGFYIGVEVTPDYVFVYERLDIPK